VLWSQKAYVVALEGEEEPPLFVQLEGKKRGEMGLLSNGASYSLWLLNFEADSYIS
jgi:hypothetical protein